MDSSSLFVAKRMASHVSSRPSTRFVANANARRASANANKRQQRLGARSTRGKARDDAKSSEGEWTRDARVRARRPDTRGRGDDGDDGGSTNVGTTEDEFDDQFDGEPLDDDGDDEGFGMNFSAERGFSARAGRDEDEDASWTAFGGGNWNNSPSGRDVAEVSAGRGGREGSTWGQPPDDIITDGGQEWFDNDADWFEPVYKEVNARKGSVLEKVQRMHLNEPSDFSFKDGEYFDLMGYVKAKTDNEFCLVLEVAERARERKIERLESLNPSRSSLGPIQQAIADLALEVEMSGGKTSAYLAMREAADRARLRYELQQASWCWDKYCEDSMRAMGVSEKAEKMLHMGERQNEAMDFERDLLQEET